MVDHVKQYKIPKHYLYLSDDDSSEKDEKKSIEKESDNNSDEDKLDKIQKKQFKPTGPDGRSWGDFRKNT